MESPREESNLPTDPTPDDIMDTTEARDAPSEDDVSVVNAAAAIDEEEEEEEEEEDDAGLFGSGSEDEQEPHLVNGKRRKLDDAELDSGDDEGRNDRIEDETNIMDDEDQEQQQVTISDMSLCPHSIPHGSDKELYVLKYPQTIGVAKRKFVPETWQPPVTHHHTKAAPSTSFSPSQTSKTTVRWRRSPRKRRRLQSNSRIIRWTDGSLTMQMATNSLEQYELPAKSLAPPQRNPLKPTPTAMNRGKSVNGAADYDARMDSHTYLASAHQSTGFLQITNHVTASLNVQATGEQEDDALIRLQESMAAAVKGNKTAADGSVPIISISEDPELAKKKAELAEREKIRAQRRRQNQEERERDRANRVLGRSGLRTGGMGGLTVGGLEDDDDMATSRPKARPARKPRRRNSEYSDDEEDYRNRGRTREDEYDEDDGFLVGSDVEPELIDDDDDEEEEELDEEESSKGRSKKLKDSAAGASDDAAGGARTKRRRVVDDDEDEV